MSCSNGYAVCAGQGVYATEPMTSPDTMSRKPSAPSPRRESSDTRQRDTGVPRLQGLGDDGRCLFDAPVYDVSRPGQVPRPDRRVRTLG